MINFGRMLLPSLVFLDPTAEFVAKLIELANGGRIVDCGAGVGRLARRLADSGADVLAVDLSPRESTEFPIEIRDASDISFRPGDVAVIARPCRGGWIEATTYSTPEEALAVRVKITPTIANEYVGRDVHAHAEMRDFPQRPGCSEVSSETASHMLADALHYADPESMDDLYPPIRRAYQALVHQLRLANVRPATR